MPLLRQIIGHRVNNSFFGSGQIITTNADENYIGQTMRSTRGELACSSTYKDYHTLDNIKDIFYGVGDFIEFRFKMPINEDEHVFLGGDINNQRHLLYRDSASFIQYRTSNVNQTEFYQIRWTGISFNFDQFYTIRLEQNTANTIKLYIDGVDQGTGTAAGTIPFRSFPVSYINRYAPDLGFTNTYDYVNLNGDLFDYNETGNDPTVFYTRTYAQYKGLITTTSLNPNYIQDVVRANNGEVFLNNTNEDKITLKTLTAIDKTINVLPDGGYLETCITPLNGDGVCVFHNTDTDSRLIINQSTNSLELVEDNGISHIINNNVYHSFVLGQESKIRLERSSEINVNVFIEGEFLVSIPILAAATFSANTLGNYNNSQSCILHSLTADNLIFNLDEDANNPNVYTKLIDFVSIQYFNLLGQSNAMGRVDPNSLPSNLKGIIPDVLIYDLATNSIVKYNPLKSSQSDKPDNYGVELYLSQLIRDNSGNPVLVFKYGKGATFLSDEFTTPNWNVNSIGQLWDNTKDFYLKFKETLNKHGLRLGNDYGLIWWQGEEDATELAAANSYESNELAFFADYRANIGKSKKIISMRVQDIDTYSETVRTAKDNIAAAQSDTNIIDTDSYTTIDGVHMDDSSLQTAANDIYNLIH